MYDDASYYTFVPSAQEDNSLKTSHRRKQSLLKQPDEDIPADVALLDGNDQVSEIRSTGPPKATLARRSQSYSDFHDAVKAVLDQDARRARRRSEVVEKVPDIKSELEFFDWCNDLENDLLDNSHEEYKTYHKQLELSRSHLDYLLSETTLTLDLLDSLSNSFIAVEAQTTLFQKQCERLLQDQKRMTGLADDLRDNLKFYDYLEPITRRLNAPGAGNFVRSKEFSDMLSHLDVCLNYMAAHPSHSEASTYRSRYRLLMTRGLTLIRVHFVDGLRDIASDVSKRIADKQLNDNTMSALLYAKFRVGASELKEVAFEIRKRSVISAGAEPGAEAEYQSLMNELYTSYAATRGRLVIPLTRKKMNEISLASSTSKELVSFARSSIGYVRGVCSDEYELWCEWFEGEDGLYDFLESVCEPLYDYLRPRIIHENQLQKLCELCTLLQTRYIHDEDEEVEPMGSNELDFSILILPALEDAQTRLVFLAQGIVREDIEKYKPRPDILDYPARNKLVSLFGTKSQVPVTSRRKGSAVESTTPIPQTPKIVEEGDSPTGRWGVDTQAAFEGWYPTLKKAIWLLSRIYRLVNSTVFDDLAHQIVHHTTVSLHQAAAMIKTQATNVDGQLFLIKHLLILKQQIVAFDIEYVTPDVSFDFSGVTNTFWELRERGGLFDPRNFWRFMGSGLLPKVVENMLDAKVELDGRLRTVINEFTGEFASRMTKPVDELTSSKRGTDAVQAGKKMQQLAEKEVPLLRQKLDEYLDDIRTKETLVAAVQDQVIQNYENFYDTYTAERRSNGRAVSKKGKGRDDEAWDPDMLSEWTIGLFNVGKFDSLDGDESSRNISRNGSI
ncbi:MAG: Golgi transport complex subunit 3 [Heterodermia speciosa]|uniref:Conserved oligomeric Golgi complex subunit 3 n=1 Tax=Heterodermia speciosa TaxID=116794 RepID=A0A8H3IQ62_9LECA|nr:MAG: Golgi transport complex subunit 3 [Heterodermia speciosa]